MSLFVIIHHLVPKWCWHLLWVNCTHKTKTTFFYNCATITDEFKLSHISIDSRGRCSRNKGPEFPLKFQGTCHNINHFKGNWVLANKAIMKRYKYISQLLRIVLNIITLLKNCSTQCSSLLSMIGFHGKIVLLTQL